MTISATARPSTGATPFHEGERAVQSRMGVLDRMAVVGPNVIRDHMPEQHRDFYRQLPFLVLGTQDSDGQPWATIVSGRPGFVQSSDPQHLEIAAYLPADDPALIHLSNGSAIGGLGLEFETRRRNRFTAHVVRHHKAGIDLRIDQSFGNCPQYIQTRALVEMRDPTEPFAGQKETSTVLDDEVRRLIEAADTFFVASSTPAAHPSAPQHGVDVSHRGGMSGFVRVEDDRTLLVPDYSGNRFFNTLGNFVVNPHAGLLFVDFETGGTVHLAGKVDIVWSGPEVDQFPKAERAWRFKLTHAIKRPGALPMRFEFGEYSPKSVANGTWHDTQA